MDYQKARSAILKHIADRDYAIGDKIPSINKLVKVLGLGKISVQKAVKQLETEGVLENIPRSGCYIKRILDDNMETEGNSVDSGTLFISTFMRDPRKKIRIGILSDLTFFPHLWKKIFLDYMREHKDINIELVPLATLDDICEKQIENEFDIFQIPSSYLRFFVESGALFDLSQIDEEIIHESDFYPAHVGGATYNDRIWGVPLICSTVCLFSNQKYEKNISDLNPAGGLWSFLGNAENTKLGSAREAILNIDHSLYDLVKLIDTKRHFDMDHMKFFTDDLFEELTSRFEPFFRNPNVIAPFFSSASSVHESAANNFLSEKSASILSCSVSVVEFTQKAPFQFSILPLPFERNGSCVTEAALNVISSQSKYPLECSDILRHLASFDIQNYFAREGRLTAHSKANQSLNLKGLDDASHQNIIRSLENGVVEKGNGIDIAQFTHTVAFYEMRHWQMKAFDYKELLRHLRKKARFFFAPQNINRNNSITEKAI